MDTKKAIMGIECLINYLNQVRGFIEGRDDRNIITYPIDEVIQYLREGEKYKNMWEEFEHKRGDTYCIINQPDKGTIRDDMNDFKQKYFPKEK